MKGPAVDPATASNTPGVLLTALAAAAFLICLGSFAVRHTGIGVGAASIALFASGAALSWLSAQARRVRDAQRSRRDGQRGVAP
jgi:hypothetical protein